MISSHEAHEEGLNPGRFPALFSKNEANFGVAANCALAGLKAQSPVNPAFSCQDQMSQRSGRPTRGQALRTAWPNRLRPSKSQMQPMPDNFLRSIPVSTEVEIAGHQTQTSSSLVTVSHFRAMQAGNSPYLASFRSFRKCWRSVWLIFCDFDHIRCGN